jgi:hypothetical protein
MRVGRSGWKMAVIFPDLRAQACTVARFSAALQCRAFVTCIRDVHS